MASRFDDFRIVRFWRRLNRATQLLLAVSLVAGLNYLASQPAFFLRRDLTASASRSLSPDTTAQLRALAARPGDTAKSPALPPVEIFVTLPRTVQGESDAAREQKRILDTIHAQMSTMLDAFAYTTGREWREPLRITNADFSRNAKLYTELASALKENFNPVSTALVVRCGERAKAIGAPELFQVRQGRKGQVELDGFRGEAAVLSAILEVADFRRPVVYYTSNHGELSPESPNPLRSDSRLIAELRSRRFDLRALDLEQAREVPADAELLLVAGPLADFTPREADKVRRFLRERNGRLLALLEPGTPSGLEDVLLDWGVLAMDALVVDTDPKGKSPDGDVIVSRLPEQLHETTRILQETNLPLYAGRLRPVQADPGMPLDDTLSVSGLFYSSDSAWGERDYRRPPFRADFDKGDLPPALCLGVAAEKSVRMQGEVRIPGSRLVVLGSSDLATDARFDKGGNRHFLVNATNWLLGRSYLVNVPPRPLQEYKLNATAGDLTALGRRYALLPLGVALLGLLVHTWRRRS